MLALHRQEVHVDVGELAALFLGDGADAHAADPEVAHRHAVGSLAGDSAGKAARATVQVSDDCILRHSGFLSSQ